MAEIVLPAVTPMQPPVPAGAAVLMDSASGSEMFAALVDAIGGGGASASPSPDPASPAAIAVPVPPGDPAPGLPPARRAGPVAPELKITSPALPDLASADIPTSREAAAGAPRDDDDVKHADDARPASPLEQPVFTAMAMLGIVQPTSGATVKAAAAAPLLAAPVRTPDAPASIPGAEPVATAARPSSPERMAAAEAAVTALASGTTVISGQPVGSDIVAPARPAALSETPARTAAGTAVAPNTVEPRDPPPAPPSSSALARAVPGAATLAAPTSSHGAVFSMERPAAEPSAARDAAVLSEPNAARDAAALPEPRHPEVARGEPAGPRARAISHTASAGETAATPTKPPSRAVRERVAEPLPMGSPAVAAERADRAVSPAAPFAPENGVARQLAVTHDGQWLDQLARDIATVSGDDSRLNFRLDPVHLGSLAVSVERSDEGAVVHLQTSTEQARQILVDAQPRLAAEARAQGLNLREATVGTAADNGGGSSSRHGTAGQPAHGFGHGQGGQQRQASPDRQTFVRPVAQAVRRAPASTERYA